MAIATSYGTITIVDITDIGELSVYPSCNVPSTQLYNPNDGSYEPGWTSSNPAILTPTVFYAGSALNMNELKDITWHRGIGANKGAAIKEDDETGYDTNEYVQSTDKKLVIKSNILNTIPSKSISYTVHVEYEVDGHTLIAEGQIDFNLLTQGTSAKVARIIGNNVFNLDWEGNTKTQNASITLDLQTTSNIAPGYIYEGTSNAVIWEYKSGNSWLAFGSTKQVTPVTFTYSELRTLFSNDELVIRGRTNDSTVYDLITISLLRDGAPGENAISGTLSNSDQMIPVTTNDGVETTDYSTAFTHITILRASDTGTVDDTSKWSIKIKPSSGVTFQHSSTGADGSWTQNYTTEQSNTGRYGRIVNMTGESGTLTFTCTRTGYAPIVQVFTVTKIRAGIDGQTPTIYSLNVSAAGVNQSATTPYVYTPSSVTFTAKEHGEDSNGQVGTRNFTSGKIRLETKDGNNVIKINNSGNRVTDDTSALNYVRTLIMGGVVNSYVKATLYDVANNELDVQYVPIVNDGIKGDPGLPGVGSPSVILDDENETIPCNSDNYPLGSTGFTTGINFTARQGNELLLIDSITVTENSSPSLTHFTSTVPNVSTTPASSGTITLNFSKQDKLADKGTVTIRFVSNHVKYYSNGTLYNNGTITIDKVYSWTAQAAAVDARLLQIVCKQNVFSEVNKNQVLTAVAYLTEGTENRTDEVSGSYVWSKYDPTGTGHDSDGYVTVGTDTTQDVYTSDTKNKQLNVKRDAVSGYASFRLQLINNNVVTAVQYIAFTDKFDPIQVSVHSTVGTQIKNQQGQGALYARVTQTNVGQVDMVPESIESGTSTPISNTSSDDYFVLLSQQANAYQRTATLYHCPVGSTGAVGTPGNGWTAQYATCKYHWTFRDSTNKIITQNTKLPYQNNDLTHNQFIYINADLIDGKITADVEVTLD